MTSPRLISKLHEIDPVFRDLIDELYGVSKASPGASDVHVDGAQRKRERRQAQVGLASNAVGIAAGVGGLKEVAGREAFRDGGKLGRAVYAGGRAAGKVPGIARVGRAVAAHPVAAAGGALTLQAANLAGDAVSNRVLARSAQDPNKKKVVLVKAAVPHLQPRTLVAANARTRTSGLRLVRPSSTVPMAKRLGLRGAYRNAKATTENVRVATEHAAQAGAHANRASASAADTAAKVNRLIPSRKVAATIGGGSLIAVSGAAAGGSYAATRQVKKPRRVTPARVVIAPPAPVALGKDVTFVSAIAKVDTDKRQVFGWANVAQVNGQPVVDLQGDYVPIEEMESSAYSYVLTSRKGGHMHQRIGKADSGPVHVADLVESFVSTPEKLQAMGLAPDAIPLGWWCGFKVHDDDVWAKVKSGELTGLSIHGTGRREEIAS